MKYNNFVHRPVAGDGSCFFHSLATIILTDEYGKFPNNNAVNIESRILRRECVSWLKKNLNYKIKGTGLTIRSEIEEDIKESHINTVQEYLKYMKTPDAYAGQIEIYAMAHILKRNIRVYIHNKEKFSNVGLGYQINNHKGIEDIYLYHNLGKTKSKGLHHFEPLYPKSKLKYNVNYKMHKPINTRRRSKRSNTRRRNISKRRRSRRSNTRRRISRRSNTRRRNTRRRDNRRRDNRRRDNRRKSKSKKGSVLGWTKKAPGWCGFTGCENKSKHFREIGGEMVAYCDDHNRPWGTKTSQTSKTSKTKANPSKGAAGGATGDTGAIGDKRKRKSKSTSNLGSLK